MKKIYRFNRNYQNDEDSRGRKTMFASKTFDRNQVEQVVRTISLEKHLTLDYIVKTLQKYPKLKDEPQLNKQIFNNIPLVKDIIYCILQPHKMSSQLGISLEQAWKYSEILANFLKKNNDFIEYFFIYADKKILSMQIWFEFLSQSSQIPFSVALEYISLIINPFLLYQYGSSTRIWEYYDGQQKIEQPSVLVINLFSDEFIQRLAKYSCYQPIFEILFNLILTSFQEQQWTRSLVALKALCSSCIQKGMTLDSHVENMYQMVKDVADNISNNKHNTIFAFIDAFVETSIVNCSICRILHMIDSKKEIKTQLSFSFQEQIIIQFNFKILHYITNIYNLLSKIGITCQNGTMKKLHQQILPIFQSFHLLINIIRIPQVRMSRISSGQNIKSISLYKYEFFNLLHSSLILIRQHGQKYPEFTMDISKLQILQTLKKYLTQNRWNNLMQILIEKIISLLISIEYFRSKNCYLNKFLQFLIEAFSNKKYVFLNSTKMTAQGDLYVLYLISRKMTNELQKIFKVLDVAKQIETWKKFVINVLQSYEKKVYQTSISFSEEIDNKGKENQQFRVEIDQVQPIRQIIKRIQTNQTWMNLKEEVPNSMRINSASTHKRHRPLSTKKTDYLSGSGGNKEIHRLVNSDVSQQLNPPKATKVNFENSLEPPNDVHLLKCESSIIHSHSDSKLNPLNFAKKQSSIVAEE